MPEEVAVIGVDDEEELCELCEPPLSSVVPNAEMVGYQAAELLDRLMSGGKSRVAPRGRRRSGSPPANRPTCWRSTTPRSPPRSASSARTPAEGAKVDDILGDVPVSRSILERRFRKYLGHSPQALIRQTRLKRVKQLLVDTDLTLAKISTLAGFRHQEHMCVLFKKEVGDSPAHTAGRSRGPAPSSIPRPDIRAAFSWIFTQK